MNGKIMGGGLRPLHTGGSAPFVAMILLIPIRLFVSVYLHLNLLTFIISLFQVCIGRLSTVLLLYNCCFSELLKIVESQFLFFQPQQFCSHTRKFQNPVSMGSWRCWLAGILGDPELLGALGGHSKTKKYK